MYEKRIKYYTILALAFLAVFGLKSPVFGEKSPITQEIDHLLNFIESSNCVMIRNSKDHSSKKALKHINKKYNHFKDVIHSAEDFIKYSSTKSELTGNYYQIKCTNGETIKSEKWLLNELNKYRNNNNGNT